MISSQNLRRSLLAASMLGATALLSACGSGPTSQTTERTTTTTVAPPPGTAMVMPPSSTTTTTRTQSQTP
jgi:ABC-type glycerol-3-phosphate transport system substrate-binding protein